MADYINCNKEKEDSSVGELNQVDDQSASRVQETAKDAKDGVTTEAASEDIKYDETLSKKRKNPDYTDSGEAKRKRVEIGSAESLNEQNAKNYEVLDVTSNVSKESDDPSSDLSERCTPCNEKTESIKEIYARLKKEDDAEKANKCTSPIISADNGLISDDSDGSTQDDKDVDTFQTEITVTRPEAKIFPKLYRLLGKHDSYGDGLRAKDPTSNRSVGQHVANGSNGYDSKYISTCSYLNGAERLRNYKSRSRRYRNGIKTIVEIDVNKLPLDVSIIDLTTIEKRRQYEYGLDESEKMKFHKHANKFSEVLLEGEVPPECLKVVSTS